MKGNQRIRCTRKPEDRPPGYGTWHSPHAAQHCLGKICRWQKARKASRCPMKRSA